MSSGVLLKSVIAGVIGDIPGSLSTGVKFYIEDIDLSGYNNLNYCPIKW